MKKTLLLFLGFSLICKMGYAQSNMVPNSGFEDGPYAPTCNYAPLTNTSIDNDIDYWQSNSNVKIHHKHSYPQWCPYSTSPYYGNYRYIHMHEAIIGTLNTKPNEQDDIWVGLNSPLQGNSWYTLRVQLSPDDYGTYGGETYEDGNENVFNVYFSKFGAHWYRNWGNERVEYNSAITIPTSAPSIYQTYEFTFYTFPLFNASWTSLTNIVLSVSSGGLDIDNVELFEACPDNLAIQNQNYYYYDYPYHASQNIAAGYNVGGPGPSGDVEVHSGANITYTAGNKVDLEPGFHADKGSVFTANIAPCSPMRIEDPTTDTSIKVVTNTITLTCPTNTLNIVGIDGDTTAYVAYYWNFGNGETSTSSHPSIYYNTPGNYTITLYGTDSVGNIDTLTENIIVPDCNAERTLTQNNDGSTQQGISNKNIRKYHCLLKPNPNNGKFTITLPFASKNVRIDIYNILGQKVYAQTGIAHGTVFALNISNQPSGLYLVRVLDNGKAYSQKIIKQ